MSIEFTPKKDGVWLSSQYIKDHNDRLGSGVGRTRIHETVFSELKSKSPAKAAYCISIFKRCWRVQLPRGCKF